MDTSLRILHEKKRSISFDQLSHRELKSKNVTDFTQTLTIKVAIPYLLNLNDQEILKDVMKHTIEEESDMFFNISINILAEMHEKRRRGHIMEFWERNNNKDDILIILVVSGYYNSNMLEPGIDIKIQLQQVVKNCSFNFTQNVKDHNSVLYNANVTDIEVIDTPVIFESYERDSLISYANMESKEKINETNFMSNTDNKGLIGLFILSMGLIVTLAITSFIRRKNQKLNIKNSKINRKAKLKRDEQMKRKLNDEKVVQVENKFSSLYSGKLKEENMEGLSYGKCVAPKGKLGISIFPVDSIPVVYKVKTGSPLEGILFRMDRIVGIDEIDTSSMAAADITKIIVNRLGKQRLIHFLRKIGGQEAPSITSTFSDETIPNVMSL